MHTMLTPEQVLREHYGVHNPTIIRLSGGLIHMTLRVNDENGGVFILQSVAPIFKPDVMQDIAAVLEHIEAAGFVTEKIIPTLTGESYVSDNDRFWRMFTFIPGKMFPEANITEELAYEAGSLLGEYHQRLQSIDHSFVHVRAAKHNFSAIYDKYVNLAKPQLDSGMIAMAEAIDVIPDLLPPKTFGTHVTHGDPKINNFIFSESEPHQAISMIDLDDCGAQYNAAIEVAKALKSWSTDTSGNRTVVSTTILEAGIRGYQKTASSFLTPSEWAWIPSGMKLLALELGTRFLIDVFEDCYFDWDQSAYSSRKEHNVVRFKEQIEMYQSLVEAEKKIRAVFVT